MSNFGMYLPFMHHKLLFRCALFVAFEAGDKFSPIVNVLEMFLNQEFTFVGKKTIWAFYIFSLHSRMVFNVPIEASFIS